MFIYVYVFSASTNNCNFLNVILSFFSFSHILLTYSVMKNGFIRKKYYEKASSIILINGRNVILF